MRVEPTLLQQRIPNRYVALSPRLWEQLHYKTKYNIFDDFCKRNTFYPNKHKNRVFCSVWLDKQIYNMQFFFENWSWNLIFLTISIVTEHLYFYLHFNCCPRNNIKASGFGTKQKEVHPPSLHTSDMITGLICRITWVPMFTYVGHDIY